MWYNKCPTKKPVRILDLKRIKTIDELKDLYVIRGIITPYTIKIRLHKDVEVLLKDIEHLFVDEGN